MQIVIDWIRKTFLEIACQFALVPAVWLSVNICGIHLVEIPRTFKIRFKMKCTRISNFQPLFIFSPDFWDICLACYSHKLTIFCCDFNRLSSTLKCLSPSFSKYLIRHYQVPRLAKICITEWLSFVDLVHCIWFFFFKFHPVPNFFPTIMDELLYLNDFRLKLWSFWLMLMPFKISCI